MAGRRITSRKPSVDLRSKIRSALRRVWSAYSPEREQVLYEARRTRKRLKKDGTPYKVPAVFYKCASCGGEFKSDEVQVDHVVAVGATPPFPPETESTDWVVWMLKLFCRVENLQCLCVTCHTQKTREDRKNLNK